MHTRDGDYTSRGASSQLQPGAELMCTCALYDMFSIVVMKKATLPWARKYFDRAVELERKFYRDLGDDSLWNILCIITTVSLRILNQVVVACVDDVVSTIIFGSWL
ncbi:hypothetical protein EON65_50980 [archaeon]|nr:MAG: hypothetical protein EON65_50980 [archaeon]